jgi:hypothetical protein
MSQSFTTTMSQSSNQTSPSNTSPKHNSPSKDTTPVAQPSDIIIDAVPLTMVHPSFASILNPKTTKPSPSSKLKSKTKTTEKPKPQKSKSRYSSNFDMQKLYLDDLGNASTNVASNAATTTPNVEIKTAEGIFPKSLYFEKGEIAVETEETKNIVPNTPSDDGGDEDQLNLKDAEDTIKSRANSVSSANDVPDAPTSLAQAQSQHDLGDVEDAAEENVEHVIVDSHV